MSVDKSKGWMREEMPGVAAIVDEFREVFGTEDVTRWIAVMRQRGEFWAEDYVTGKTLGLRPPESGAVMAMAHRSPGGLPSMLEVQRLMNGDVKYKGERMTMNQFIARHATHGGKGR